MNHVCPRCGTQTNGTWSEGGIKWDLCQNCMESERTKGALDYGRAIDERLSMGLSEDED